MSVNLVKDCEGIIVHTMNFVHRERPVFYASLPAGRCDTEISTTKGTNREEAKHCLVSFLWDHLVAMENPLWKRRQSSNGDAFSIQVACGLLGRPHLLVGEHPGPAVSFSEGGGNVWAALSSDESDIGIDVAGADEFQEEYPFHRVFHPEELQHALRSTAGDREMASALLWSVKEAVVKALGCAFHLVDPRQITVSPSGEGDEYTFFVRLSGKALKRFPLATRETLWVRSLPQGKRWVSIALLNRRSAGNA